MNTIELGVLFGFISIIIVIITFFIGRQSSARHEGASLEGMRKDIEYMMKDIKYIRDSLEESARNNKYSIRRVHNRIDSIEAFLREQGYTITQSMEDE